MKEKLIPLAQHADYAAAAEKLAGYRAQLVAAKAEAESIGLQVRLIQQRTPETPEQILAAADGAMAGTMPADLPERQRRNEALIAALRKAIGVQETELARIRNVHSIAAGKATRARHIATVGPLLAAMNALADAIEAERAVRDELDALGYSAAQLPSMGFVVPAWDYQFNPRDTDSTFWRHWWDERERYVATGLTPAEHDAALAQADAAARRATDAAKVIAPTKRTSPDRGELVR